MAKVLIVDDAPYIVTVLTGLLTNQGYDVLVAFDGREALEVAAAKHPDVILLDSMMAGLDGIETCRRLKVDAELARIPVMLIVAGDVEQDIVAGLAAGAEDFVTKPFNPRLLLARLQAAVRLKDSRDELARKDQELRDARSMEAVGRMAAGIAHEFNNLLHAIRAYAKLAMDAIQPEGQGRNDIQQVLKATDIAATLARQLLHFSRRRAFHRENIDTNEVVAGFAKALQSIVGEQISLEIALGGEATGVYCDPGEIQQILLNLCLNARDAMPSGGKLLLKTVCTTLSAEDWDPRFHIHSGRHVVLSVTDTGQGMSSEVRRRIFKPFFTTKVAGKGAGLGLATVYGIVKQHKGAIYVYSKPDRGTTFKVYLPSTSHNAVESSKSELAPAPGGSETILVAEEEAMVRQMAVRRLAEQGYNVLTAADGQDAARMIAEGGESISLLILGAFLPGIGIQELYRRIKDDRPQTKIVVGIGYAPEVARVTLGLPEDVRLLEKPFDAATLLRTVRQVLDDGRACPRATLATG